MQHSLCSSGLSIKTCIYFEQLLIWIITNYKIFFSNYLNNPRKGNKNWCREFAQKLTAKTATQWKTEAFYRMCVLNKAILEKIKTVARTSLPSGEITGIHGNTFHDIPSEFICNSWFLYRFSAKWLFLVFAWENEIMKSHRQLKMLLASLLSYKRPARCLVNSFIIWMMHLYY